MSTWALSNVITTILDLAPRKDSMLKSGRGRQSSKRGEIKRSYLVPLEAGPNTRRPRSPAISPHGANKLISLLTEIHSDIRQIKTDLQ